MCHSLGAQGLALQVLATLRPKCPEAGHASTTHPQSLVRLGPTTRLGPQRGSSPQATATLCVAVLCSAGLRSVPFGGPPFCSVRRASVPFRLAGLRSVPSVGFRSVPSVGLRSVPFRSAGRPERKPHIEQGFVS